MKKITTVAVFMLLLFQTKAQNFSLTYGKEFVSNEGLKFKGNKLVPQAISQFSVGYSQSLKKIPITVNISAHRRGKRPPGIIILEQPPIIVRTYDFLKNIEADSIGFSKEKTNSVDLLVGAGYILPHKAGNKFVVTANVDFGVSINNKQALNFYYQKKLTGTVEIVKTQFVFSPNIKAKYSLTKALGIGVGVGYTNIGGVNATSSIIINPFRRPKDGCSHWQCCGVCDWFPRRKGD